MAAGARKRDLFEPAAGRRPFNGSVTGASRDCNTRRLGSVSYTHLDVYKRQAIQIDADGVLTDYLVTAYTHPDFADAAAMADALLHPRDRAYSVPQFYEFLENAYLEFGRWIRQAPYLSLIHI